MTRPDRGITYLSERSQEYVQGLAGVESLFKLRIFLGRWHALVDDAYQIAWGMSEADWAEFQRGYALEREKKFAGEDWAEKYGPILMPTILFRVSLVAVRYGVPWGTAFIRLKEEKLIQKQGGVYVWVEPK